METETMIHIAVWVFVIAGLIVGLVDWKPRKKKTEKESK